MADSVELAPLTAGSKRLNLFERYLTLWVGLCMVLGVSFGKLAPDATRVLRGIEFGEGSQVNLPIAVLIWLMITPMMMKVDFTSIRNVGKRPRGLLVTLFVNWLVKPFSMALIGYSASCIRGVGGIEAVMGHLAQSPSTLPLLRGPWDPPDTEENEAWVPAWRFGQAVAR